MRYQVVNAHITVAKLAEEMAQEVYEHLAKDNKFYAVNKDRRHIVKQIAPTLHAEARKVLAEMLARNDVSDHEKHEIYEALILDNAIPKPSNRRVAVPNYH